MGKKKTEREDPLEQSLIRAMSLLDNQVAREMQRTPAELSAEGVQKWEPYNKRVELVTTIVLGSVGEQTLELDSLIILARSMVKALYLYADELGSDGLGKLRSSYCAGAAKEIEDDVRKLQAIVDNQTPLLS